MKGNEKWVLSNRTRGERGRHEKREGEIDERSEEREYFVFKQHEKNSNTDCTSPSLSLFLPPLYPS